MSSEQQYNMKWATISFNNNFPFHRIDSSYPFILAIRVWHENHSTAGCLLCSFVFAQGSEEKDVH